MSWTHVLCSRQQSNTEQHYLLSVKPARHDLKVNTSCMTKKTFVGRLFVTMKLWVTVTLIWTLSAVFYLQVLLDKQIWYNFLHHNLTDWSVVLFTDVHFSTRFHAGDVVLFCSQVQTGGSQGQILHNCLLSEKEAKMSTCLRESEY